MNCLTDCVSWLLGVPEPRLKKYTDPLALQEVFRGSPPDSYRGIHIDELNVILLKFFGAVLLPVEPEPGLMNKRGETLDCDPVIEVYRQGLVQKGNHVTGFKRHLGNTWVRDNNRTHIESGLQLPPANLYYALLWTQTQNKNFLEVST